MYLRSKITGALMGAILLSACGSETTTAPTESVTPPVSKQDVFVSDAVKSANKAVADYLDFSDRRDFERANQGFIATFDDTAITMPDGSPVYDFGAHDFVKGEAPDSVNPSLWRQSELNALHGLFKVTDGIYQVRNFDLSNITFIEGETGWIVVDPLITKEVVERAKALVDRELGERPVSAVIFTHSHIDHYGGVRGLISEADVEAGVEVIAPREFVRESVSESILAGNAMARRASYMFGSLLPKDAAHQVGVGLGQAISSGTPGLVRPTLDVTHTGQKLMVDGIEMEMILALESEAPAEFMFYMPKYKAFCQAEVINHTLHNMYTPRGAKVRDGRRWSQYIDEAVYLYGDKTDVSFGSHHWPVWGSEDVIELWEGQRDLYRFIHDQTVRLANQGYTMHEIPELLDMPDGIARQFANRGYYGTISHNSKAQYQLYYGYFDGNPANLHPLPPVDDAKKTIDYMGGADAVLEKARTDFDQGEFRYVASVLNKLVFAEPDNERAAKLLADTYRQMAYTAESGSWRNFFLTGASELENGILNLPTPRTSSPDTVSAVPLDLYFDLLAVRLDAAKAAKKDRDVNFVITDTA